MRDKQPTLVVGQYDRFLLYQREHPGRWLVHVGRAQDALGWHAAAAVMVGPWTKDYSHAFTVAKERVR